jgi:hypothetical protein
LPNPIMARFIFSGIFLLLKEIEIFFILKDSNLSILCV